jgi:hypothetical protein
MTMPISGDKYSFTRKRVAQAPTFSGIYLLYDGDECIYIGSAEGEEGVRARLQAHKRGDEGQCTQSATGYKTEPANSPKVVEGILLEYYRQEHGRLPRCNQLMP